MTETLQRYDMIATWSGARMEKREDGGWVDHEESNEIIKKLVTASAKAFAELNAIRARDGVPRTYDGTKVSVCQEYFSSVVDELDEAVRAATGLTAHLHPNLHFHRSPSNVTRKRSG